MIRKLFLVLLLLTFFNSKLNCGWDFGYIGMSFVPITLACADTIIQSCIKVGSKAGSACSKVSSVGIDYGFYVLKFGARNSIPIYFWNSFLIPTSVGLAYTLYYKKFHKKQLELARIQKRVEAKLDALTMQKNMLDEMLKDCYLKDKVKNYLPLQEQKRIRGDIQTIIKNLNKIEDLKQQAVSDAAEKIKKILDIKEEDQLDESAEKRKQKTQIAQVA